MTTPEVKRRGRLARGKKYAIRVEAALTNAGTEVVLLMWIPSSGCTVPKNDSVVLAPGQAHTFTGTLPSCAAVLLIEMAPPDGGATEIEVTVDDERRDHSPAESGMVRWSYDV